MALQINTNVSAINMTQVLRQSGQRLSTSVTRLSTGFRINTDFDDKTSEKLAANINAGAERIRQTREVKDTVTVQNRNKAEGAASEQQRVDARQNMISIKDADMASEISSFIQGQLKQLQGAAILAQGGGAPQAVLSLLRD